MAAQFEGAGDANPPVHPSVERSLQQGSSGRRLHETRVFAMIMLPYCAIVSADGSSYGLRFYTRQSSRE